MITFYLAVSFAIWAWAWFLLTRMTFTMAMRRSTQSRLRSLRAKLALAARRGEVEPGAWYKQATTLIDVYTGIPPAFLPGLITVGTIVWRNRSLGRETTFVEPEGALEQRAQREILGLVVRLLKYRSLMLWLLLKLAQFWAALLHRQAPVERVVETVATHLGPQARPATAA